MRGRLLTFCQGWNTPSAMIGLVLATGLGMASLIGWALVRALGEGRWTLVAVLPLALLVLVGLVPVLLRWPVISTFGVYAFLVPLDSVAVMAEGGATITKLVGMLAAAVLLGAGLVERRLIQPPAAALWWCLLALWAVMSAAWAVDSDIVFGRLPTMLSLVALYLVAVSFRVSTKELSWICVMMVLGGAMAAGTGYFLGFDEEATGGAARGRLTIGQENTNPNTLAAVLVLPMALAIGGFIGLRGLLTKVAAIAAMGLMTVGLYITMSRTGIVALAVMLLVFLYRFRVRSPVVVVVAVLLSLTAAMPEAFFERMSDAVSGRAAETGGGRYDTWQGGIKALNEYWAIGAGLSNFPTVLSRYAPGLSMVAHNAYLGIWVELGIVGLGLMLAAVISHLLLAVRLRRAQSGAGIALRAAEAAAFGGLAFAFFGEVLWRKHFWMVWTLLIWASRLAQEQTDPGTEKKNRPW